ncbi:hypothetical protein [Actinophytocola gossypii]|uniref:Uncharacterized protein n=1 Tax=Actinophytocola gossypii TaxID=2812003 RepID=A0ABT2JBJ5_9PSEU|nr:hypothetical protein [Actinophytocola gossypii]MCT2585240.1 hypothetical protein [Actinophytocola gossypii]
MTSGFGMFLRAFRQVVENPEEDLVRPPSRYLPEPEDDFWGEDQPASPAVIGEDDDWLP